MVKPITLPLRPKDIINREDHMKKIIAYIMAALLVTAFASTALAEGKGSVALQEGVNVTKLNSELTLELDSNITTGFSWTAAISDDSVVALESEDYIAPESALPGASGKQAFVFTPKKAGTATITLNYKRAWEEDALKTQTYKIFVDPAKTSYSTRVGKTVEIRLPSNPSTGYMWSYELSDDSVLKAGDVRHAAGKLLGATGQDIITFDVTKTGVCSIVCKLARSGQHSVEYRVIEIVVPKK